MIVKFIGPVHRIVSLIGFIALVVVTRNGGSNPALVSNFEDSRDQSRQALNGDYNWSGATFTKLHESVFHNRE